jgi:hypothetical protein
VRPEGPPPPFIKMPEPLSPPLFSGRTGSGPRPPGDIRELRGVLEYAFVIAEGGLVHPEHLPAQITHPTAKDQVPHPTPAAPMLLTWGLALA